MEQLIFDKYKYDPDKDFLGKGAFADIYRAYDVLLERFVALKFYRNSEQAADSKYDVLNEMKQMIGLHLSHPNLIAYYDALLLTITDSLGRKFQVQIGVLEYANGKEILLTGGDLRTFINRTQPNNAQIKKIASDILQGLLFLEHHQVVHRDLKPANILMHRTKDGVWMAKIADFGLSKSIKNTEQSSAHLKGTIEYMAPEQFFPNKYGIDKKISTNADLWAFGAILYEIFSGTLPFGKRSQGSTDEQILAGVDSFEPESLNLQTIPQPFRRIISRCLVKHAAQRTQSAQELLNILNGLDETPMSGTEQTTIISETPLQNIHQTTLPPFQKQTVPQHKTAHPQNSKPTHTSAPSTLGTKLYKIVVGTALVLVAFWVIQQLFGDPLAWLFNQKNNLENQTNADTLTTVSVTQNFINFGELVQSKKAVQTIYLKNTGVNPLNIKGITSNSPYLKGDWQPKLQVMPNDSVAVTITLLTDKLSGAYSDSILYFANTFTNPSRIMVSGYIKKPFIPMRDDYSGIKEKLKETLTYYHQHRNDTLYFDDMFTNPVERYYSESGYITIADLKLKAAFQKSNAGYANSETVLATSVNYVILDGNFLADYIITENTASSGSWFGGRSNQIRMEAEITYPEFKITGIRKR
ncbi:MAG: protein kinase [Sphingobacteriales bacterium]|nr:MAG: protein kinase [Sphingobacteriales bacterium]